MISSKLAGVACTLLLAAAAISQSSATVIDDWASITAPSPPPLKAATVAEASTSALLVLDWVKQVCQFPRCVTALPIEAKLVQAARARHIRIIYTVPNLLSTIADVMPAVAPQGPDEQLAVVTFGPDKFLGSDLNHVLILAGIKTLIVTGVVGEGAVLHTSTHAAGLGYKVIVPVDTMPSRNSLFAEQYTVNNLSTGPVTKDNITLTSSDLLKL